MHALQQQTSSSLERIFDDAQYYGVLTMGGRLLKQMPCVGDKYDLSDTVTVGRSCLATHTQLRMHWPICVRRNR
jgi:hypothetical protein